MKKLAAILCLSALTTGAFAQGLVNFFNSSSTLSSATDAQGVSAATSGAIGSYYYGLLISTTPTGPFTFSGAYATNLAVAGRFTGGANVPVTGWAAGNTASYQVAIWSAGMGHDFQPGWLNGNFAGAPAGSVFGLSGIATGIAGGAGQPASPAYNLFGGATGIQTGFNAAPIGPVVPEPTSMALAGLGAAALLIFRRRK